MKHGHMSRNFAKAFFAFTTLGLAAACADNNSVAPAAETSAVVAPANYSRIGYGVTFRVNNSEGITKKIGSHVINIPAGAICDLATSGYGKTTWDKSCRPLRGSIVITATEFKGPNGQPYIDFQPALRFAPNKEVMLFFREGRTNGQFKASVQYCDLLGFCSDESLTDASLKPFRIGRSSILGRRVKHFSGYGVTYSEECEGEAIPTTDGGWQCQDEDPRGGGGIGAQRRSGYMVASGEDISDVMKDPTSERGNSNKRDEK